MARAKVVHSTDSVCVIFEGNRASPEPSTGVIKFPGGHVEVSRCSDGSYWAHVEVFHPENIGQGRIDYSDRVQGVESLPDSNRVKKLAVRVYPHRVEIRE
jgi:hypothetical protein